LLTFVFSSRRRHTRSKRDWSSDVCSSDLKATVAIAWQNVLVMLIVAFCQAMATVAFQTVTTNRIVTPSILGFESLYVAVQTGARSEERRVGKEGGGRWGASAARKSIREQW